MSYTISFENRSDYIYAHIEGKESYDEAVHFWEKLADEFQSEEIKKFLIVDKVTGRLSTIELYTLSIIVSDLFRGKTIAFIDSKDDTFEDNKFGETVIGNRGGTAKVFRSEDEGLEWLLKQ